MQMSLRCGYTAFKSQKSWETLIFLNIWFPSQNWRVRLSDRSPLKGRRASEKISMRGSKAHSHAACTCTAIIPFGPRSAMNVTTCPAFRDLTSFDSISLKCTNRSAPPPSGVINPNPFSSLKFFNGSGLTVRHIDWFATHSITHCCQSLYYARAKQTEYVPCVELISFVSDTGWCEKILVMFLLYLRIQRRQPRSYT